MVPDLRFTHRFCEPMQPQAARQVMVYQILAVDWNAKDAPL